MKIATISLLAAAVAVGSPQQPAHEIGNGVMSAPSGMTFRYKTLVEPPVNNSAFVPLGGGHGMNSSAFQHFIFDKSARSYFGYELTAVPLSDGIQVSFGPLVMTPDLRRSIEAVSGGPPYNAAPLPRYPAPQIIHDGDTIAIDLMVSADGRERIVDYIEVTAPSKTPAPPPPAASAAPRDFTIDDGPVQFPMSGTATAFVDGKKFAGYVVQIARDGGGATLWCYVPGHGRYVLSLAPRDGFVKGGTLRAGAATFQAAGHSYELRFSEPLAGAANAWNLYVRHDAAYLPNRPALVKCVVIGMGRLESLME